MLVRMEEFAESVTDRLLRRSGGFNRAWHLKLLAALRHTIPALVAKDQSTEAAMVSPEEKVELFLARVALFAGIIRHPPIMILPITRRGLRRFRSMTWCMDDAAVAEGVPASVVRSICIAIA